MVINRDESFNYTPRFERLSRLIADDSAFQNARLVYNEVADELVVFLFSDVDYSVAFDTDDDLYLLLDTETHDVIGFQIDDFMASAVLMRPQLLALASFAGVDEARIRQAQAEIGAERARQATIQSALRDLLAESPST